VGPGRVSIASKARAASVGRVWGECGASVGRISIASKARAERGPRLAMRQTHGKINLKTACIPANVRYTYIVNRS
jgi:hypothetical protein